jgi:hypothetical protein
MENENKNEAATTIKWKTKNKNEVDHKWTIKTKMRLWGIEPASFYLKCKKLTLD